MAGPLDNKYPFIRIFLSVIFIPKSNERRTLSKKMNMHGYNLFCLHAFNIPIHEYISYYIYIDVNIYIYILTAI